MLPVLHAEQQLAAIEAATVTDMKDSDRAAVVRKYVAKAKPDSGPPKAHSLSGALAQIPMTRVEVPTKEKRG